jgi:parallel beta-helix repeat protein
LKTQYFSIIILVLLLAASLGAGTLAEKQNGDAFEPLSKNTIYVDIHNTEGPWNGSYEYPYQHITDGLLHANDGDTVYVFNGIYNETVRINKSISIRGRHQEDTIIDGQNNHSVITITTNNVTISQFTIRNSGGYQGDAGIIVTADSTTISECTLYRARVGISVQHSNETVITSCRFHTNGYGILVSYSSNTTIDSCTFYHNGIGAYFLETHGITITHSYADTNGIGVLCDKSTHIHISESAVRDNDDNEGGMFFTDCFSVNVDNCYINHNGLGIDLMNSSSVYIFHCNFSLNTHFGLRFKKGVSDTLIANCIFTTNLRYGIFAQNSVFTVSWCNFFKNQNYGLYAQSSIIDAGNNWWGSKIGPAHTGLTRADRGTWDPRDIRYTPWLPSPMLDIGPTWNLYETFQKPSYSEPWPEQINFSDPDTDGDGAPDWWEIKWGYPPTIWNDHRHLDPDNDSLTNIEECYMDQYGADPFKKDVFLELDWTKSTVINETNKPPEKEITQMIDAFASHNITLHVDTGQIGGGEELPSQPYVSDADIVNLYWDYFLHNDLNNPRQRIFHYGIICDYAAGPGFAVMGWSHLNAFIIGAQFLVDTFPSYTRGWLAITSSMHEVGHTFGLIVTKYNGIDNQNAMKPLYKEFWKYLRYRSILNYLYTYSFMDFSDGSHGPGDYNDWANINFSFFKNTRFEYPISS